MKTASKIASIIAIPALLLTGMFAWGKSCRHMRKARMGKYGLKMMKWRLMRKGLTAAGRRAARAGAFIIGKRSKRKLHHIFG